MKSYLFLLLLLITGIAGAQTGKTPYETAVLAVYDNPDLAIELAEELLDTATSPQSRVNLHLLLSNAYSSKRQYETSLAYAFKAKEISEEAEDKLLQFVVISKIATQYHQLRINDKALQFLAEGDQIYEALANKQAADMTLGNNFAIRGFIFRDKLNCDIALNYFNAALEQYALPGGNKISRTINSSIITYNKGNCYITLNSLDSALKAFQASDELAHSAGANSLRGFALKGMAEVFTLQGNFDKSIETQQQALEIAGDVGDLVLLQALYQGLANNYLSLKEWEKYREFLELQQLTEAQITGSERKSIEIALNSQEKELSQTLQMQRKRYLCIGLAIIAAGIFLVFSLVIGSRNHRRKINFMKEKLNLQKQLFKE